MGWTNWRMLANHREWFGDDFDHDRAACYELAIGGPRGGGIRTVYVGETKNEKNRMTKYGRDGSHLSKIIASHLKDGWVLYYRATVMPSKKAAKAMQDRLLAAWDYDWNIILNAA